MIEKLIEIQQKLKAPKSQLNKFGGYYYRNCEDILEAAKPLLKEQKLLLTITDDLVFINERYYVKSTVSITDGNETVNCTAYAREEEDKKGMDQSQITGASSSYARKYALNGLFLIDDVKDSDSTNDGKDKKTTAKKTESSKSKTTYNLKATPEQINILAKHYIGDNLKKLLETNKITSLADMPMAKASELITKLKVKLDAKKVEETTEESNTVEEGDEE